MEKKHQFSLWYFLLALALMVALQELVFAPRTATLSYSEFKLLVKGAQISEVSIGAQNITGRFNLDGISTVLPAERVAELRRDQTGTREFVVVRVEDPDLVALNVSCCMPGAPGRVLLVTISLFTNSALAFFSAVHS